MGRAILKFYKKFLKKAGKFSGKISSFVLIPLLLFICALLGYNLIYSGKIYPNIYVAGISIGGMVPQDAAANMARNIQPPEKIVLVSFVKNYDLNSKDIDLEYDFATSSERAFGLTRTGNIFSDFLLEINLLFNPKDLGLAVSLNEDKLTKIISVISGQVSVDAVPPSIKFLKGEVSVTKGTQGSGIDQNSLRALIGNGFSFAKSDNITIPVKNVGETLSDDEALALKTRAEKFVGKSLTANFEYSSFNFKTPEILVFLSTHTGFDDGALNASIGKIAEQVDRDPQNPKFVFDAGRVSEFQPALDGIVVNRTEFKNKLTDSLSTLENGEEKTISFEIPVTKTPPEVSTDKVNNLGVRQLIGRGTSTFYHSIPSRVHNVVLAAGRINGTLVKPGDIFSFNDALGDISEFTGYQQAYIISEGKTILGDGGGVCQVSTTLFRALLNAGLPITDRTAHAYRVGYYEQNSPPGLDATVYGPSPDLKFKNDTPGYILIQAKANPKNYSLVFELYGTSDSRVSSVSKPVVADVVPALPTVYQDDPTLPTGTLKQIDFSAAGAKVTFTYTVKRNGETIYKKAFTSNYRPWAAVYLRGTAPIN